MRRDYRGVLDARERLLMENFEKWINSEKREILQRSLLHKA